MTDTEILTKAIEKAVKNGYKGFNLDGKKIIKEIIVDEINTTREYHPLSIKVRLVLIGTTISYYLGLYELIFSHSFAKAFWGKKHRIKNADVWYCSNLCGLAPMTLYDKEKDCPHNWQYHLQQMVLEENPISYIGRFL